MMLTAPSGPIIAFPTAEIAVMGPDGAVNIIYRNHLKNADKPDEERARLIAEYRAAFASPYKAAELGFIDEVIRPRMLRRRLNNALELFRDKRQNNLPRKHGNIPL